MKRFSISHLSLALPKKSAKPTTENSPPIHRWDRRDHKRQSVKRTVESARPSQSRIYQSSVARTGGRCRPVPSTEVLGYFHSSAARTWQDQTFWAKPLSFEIC